MVRPDGRASAPRTTRDNSIVQIQCFEQWKPVCPICIDRTNAIGSRLLLAADPLVEDSIVLEGFLRCSNARCQSEFPIIDGIPILHPKLRAYLSENLLPILSRNDLSESLESLLGDSCSQGSFFDTVRQHLNCYAWDHYGEFDESEEKRSSVQPGSIARVLEEGLRGMSLRGGPILEVGCGVGRATFELAKRTDEFVLGIDLHFSMLRVASQVLRYGKVRYPRRRVGLVYDRREFPVPFGQMKNVDFWVCDIHALPFMDSTFRHCIALNVLDSTSSPLEMLQGIDRSMQVEGNALLSTPYDWSTAVTPVESWIGGHSQRGALHGESVEHLRRLLDRSQYPSLSFQVVREIERFPWTLRMHDRSLMHYQVHLLNLVKQCSSRSR